MKNSKNEIRLEKIEKKLEKMQALKKLAISGLKQANKGNPFWTKREAFLSLNYARKTIKQLENVYLLEYSIK